MWKTSSTSSLAVAAIRMSKNKTSSEVQEYIRRRYEDTALVIYREQHANELSRNKRVARMQHSSSMDIAEGQEGDVRSDKLGFAPKNEVQSQVCVII